MGDRVRVSAGSDIIRWRMTGVIVNVNVEPPSGMKFTYDLKRDDGAEGMGKDDSYRLYEYLKPKLELCPLSKEVALLKRKLKIGDRIKVEERSGPGYSGEIVALDNDANVKIPRDRGRFVCDVKRDDNRGGCGKGSVYRMYDHYAPKITVLKRTKDEEEIIRLRYVLKKDSTEVKVISDMLAELERNVNVNIDDIKKRLRKLL